MPKIKHLQKRTRERITRQVERITREVGGQMNADTSREEIEEMVRQLGYTDELASLVAENFGR